MGGHDTVNLYRVVLYHCFTNFINMMITHQRYQSLHGHVFLHINSNEPDATSPYVLGMRARAAACGSFGLAKGREILMEAPSQHTQKYVYILYVLYRIITQHLSLSLSFYRPIDLSKFFGSDLHPFTSQ